MPDEDVRRMKIESQLGGLTDKRLRRLCREVLERLPVEWDAYREIAIEESDETPSPSSGSVGYASASRDEEGEEVESLPSEPLDGTEPEQSWVVTLYQKHLHLLSDTAIRWVIAHEFGHVASGLRTGSIVVGGVPVTQIAPGQYEPAVPKDQLEGAADSIALGWGFSQELQSFRAETYDY